MNLSRAKKQPPTPRQNDSTANNSIKEISARTSNELIIGLCGTIGSGLHALRTSIESRLSLHNYVVRHIHISALMKEYFSADYSKFEKNIELDSYNRYKGLQDLGNHLREKYNSHILAEAAITKISFYRERDNKDPSPTPERVAYIVDQLKHPSELELFRLIYQHNFYLFGVIRTESERKRNLRDEGIPAKHIDELFHRDRKFDDPNGQQTEKTLRDADFFIKNNQSHVAELDKKIGRYVDLIHGVNGITPTMDEKGMFSAYSASMQSACLSRQVGAAILDEDGNMIVTGRNDVPKFGGGLYSSEDGEQDYRCIHKGAKCYNDFHKEKMRKKIFSITKKFFGEENEIYTPEDLEILKKYTNKDHIEKLVDSIYNDSPINALIEYSRAIHAEMDAITSLARLHGANSKEKIIYTTTYPCHNCARHIVAAGIKKAIYIEPYEKSLALDLHDDAICDANSKSPNKVVFEQFEGVSPRRYTTLFLSKTDRKNVNGNVIKVSVRYGTHTDNQFKDSFIDYETKVFENFSKKVRLIPRHE
ncbi:anti-phage dCTP deaminase [Aeromonas veronii]|uniref:anti-phage dCTP deaminase n=1 Tax=Aeromonas sp. 601019 TaxID=2712035 RepID=UPI003A48E1A7